MKCSGMNLFDEDYSVWADILINDDEYKNRKERRPRWAVALSWIKKGLMNIAVCCNFEMEKSLTLYFSFRFCG